MKTLNTAIVAALLSLPVAAMAQQSTQEAPDVSPETGSANTEGAGGTPTEVEGATATGDTDGSLPSDNSLPDTDNAQTGSANTQPGSLKADGPTAQDAEAAKGPVDDTMDDNAGIDSAQDVDPTP